MITGSVKYYAISGNSKPVELKAIIPMQDGTTNNNTNAGNTNTTNTGLVRPAGNEITINGTNNGNITNNNLLNNQTPASNNTIQNPSPATNTYNTGVAPATGVVRNTTNAPVQPTAGRTAITR